MKIARYKDNDFERNLEDMVASSSLFDPEIDKRVRQIIDRVRKGGDDALHQLTRKFDGAVLRPGQLEVSKAECMSALVKAPDALRRAVGFASKNISEFSRHSKRRNWSMRNAQGAKVGEKFDPFDRVGVYIPGGTAPLASTALMTLLLAKVAGCPEIVACTPCGKTGALNSDLLYAVKKAGATEIYRIGGAQAIAAMALGTETIKPVQKIFGPGNAYVVAAKRLLFGHVSVDLLPGPSELLVLADKTARPEFVAADLLAQAEHGSGHERVWLATDSAALLRAVEKEIKKQLSTLSRRSFIQKTLDRNGWLVQVRSIEQGIDLANRIAPEHCEVILEKPNDAVRRILRAGAVFVGNYSPTVLGDYVAGPSHTLPTGGAGASFAGLTVDQFQRRTSVVQYNRKSLEKSLSAVRSFADMEGLDAHGRSASIRMENVK